MPLYFNPHEIMVGMCVCFVVLMLIEPRLWKRPLKTLLFGHQNDSPGQTGQAWQSMKPSNPEAERAAYVEAKLQRFKNSS